MLAGLALHAHLVDVVDGRVLAGLVEPEPAVARADHAGRPRRLHIRVSPPAWAPRGRRALRSGAPARGLGGGGGGGGNRPPLHSSIDTAAKPAFMPSRASQCETPASCARRKAAGRPGAECAAALPTVPFSPGGGTARGGMRRVAPRGAAPPPPPPANSAPGDVTLHRSFASCSAWPRALGRDMQTRSPPPSSQGWCTTAILAGRPLPRAAPRRAAPRRARTASPETACADLPGLNIGVICTGMRAAA